MIFSEILAIAETPIAQEVGTLEGILHSLHVHEDLLLGQTITFILVIALISKFGVGPIVAILEERKQKIEEIESKSEAIKTQLADAESEKAAVIAKASEDATRIVAEAKASAEKIAERKAEEAEANAAGIVARAEQQTQADKEAATAEIKAHFGKLLANATTAVTGKVLTADDQSRINEEAASTVN